MENKTGHPPRDLWAYAYLIVPPQPNNRLNAIRTIVEQENLDAELHPRIWTGRLVLERKITHILIVSDSPEQNRAINRRLEAELKRMEAEFFRTESMPIPGYPEAAEEVEELVASGGSDRAPLLPSKPDA